MRRYNLYFQCVVRFYLQPDFKFDHLRVSYAPDVSYVDISADVPVRANKISLDVFHAFVKFASLEAKRIRIHLGDGSLRFALDGDHTGYDYAAKDAIVVNSRMAPVVLESSIPVDVSMTSDVAARAILRGGGVSVTGASAHRMTAAVYSTEFSSFFSVYHSISVQMLGDEAPLYVTARSKSQDAGYVSHSHLCVSVGRHLHLILLVSAFPSMRFS